MHGMLSLAVLVAAFAGLAGWAVFVSVRLYRACSAARAGQSRAAGPVDAAPPGTGGPSGDPHLVS